MTRLLWDQVGERLFEAGIDRGVLYLSDNSGVPWSGLTGINESFGDDGSDPQYLDGVKTNDSPNIGDYSATLTALVYPEEFEEYGGSVDLGNGLFVDDQAPKPFGLSYRTLLGSDTDDVDYAYKIHIVYNVTASDDPSTYSTVSDKPEALEFSWKLSAVPQSVTNYRATAHVIVNSALLPSGIVSAIENILYGDDTDNPRLPSINELIDLIENWAPVIITPHSDTGLSQLVAGLGDLTITTVDGIYAALPSTRLTPSSVDGLSSLTI